MVGGLVADLIGANVGVVECNIFVQIQRKLNDSQRPICNDLFLCDLNDFFLIPQASREKEFSQIIMLKSKNITCTSKSHSHLSHLCLLGIIIPR